MKKSILIGTLMLMLLLTSVIATTMPHPIYGKITSEGYAIQGLDVKVTNVNTGGSLTSKTNEAGFYQADLGNFASINGFPPYWYSNTIKVTLVSCEIKDVCTKTIVISGGGNQITFDIASEDVPNDATIVKVQCFDGSVVATATECPTQKYTCSDGSEVENVDECPSGVSDIWKYIIEALALALAAFGWNKGFMGLCRYWWKRGEVYEKAGDNVNADKCKQRAVKMAKTAFANALAKKYEKRI